MALFGQWPDPNLTATPVHIDSPSDRARLIRERLPKNGLFGGLEFRISPEPFGLTAEFVKELEFLGRMLLQFNRAANLLYRLSVAGKEPPWISEWLDQGKPAGVIELQRSAIFKNELPRVIRPDLLLTETGVAITELDSVPGGIGLTGWLNQIYSESCGTPPSISERLGSGPGSAQSREASKRSYPMVGGADGMIRGFEQIFGDAERVNIVISEESATYRPEMEWISQQLRADRFCVRDTNFFDFNDGDAVYRFFELFDLPNIANAQVILALAFDRRIRLTPPIKPFLEEKMLLALLWNRNLRGFWHRELGSRFFEKMLHVVPYSWVFDPQPLPAHGAIPELGMTDWSQLKALSQKERNLVLKVSGFSERAWGSRGVFVGNDLSAEEWGAAVDFALRTFGQSPFVLQRFRKPTVIRGEWFDFETGTLIKMDSRVRLCPYFFVVGDGDAARTQLGGVLATLCPADKKIIHGMRDAILAPCSIRESA